MSRKTSIKDKRRIVLTSISCFFIIGLCIISSVSNAYQIKQKTKEKDLLINKLEELEENEKILTDDVEKLKNPEYAARYAREKYLYSKYGEKILKIH